MDWVPSGEDFSKFLLSDCEAWSGDGDGPAGSSSGRRCWQVEWEERRRKKGFGEFFLFS